MVQVGLQGMKAGRETEDRNLAGAAENFPRSEQIERRVDSQTRKQCD